MTTNNSQGQTLSGNGLNLARFYLYFFFLIFWNQKIFEYKILNASKSESRSGFSWYKYIIFLIFSFHWLFNEFLQPASLFKNNHHFGETPRKMNIKPVAKSGDSIKKILYSLEFEVFFVDLFE